MPPVEPPDAAESEQSTAATPPAPDALAWLVELLRTGPWLWRSYGLLPAVPARVRERALEGYSEAAAAPRTAWAHRAWRAFLGPHHGRAVLDDVLQHAQRSAAAGRPVAPQLLKLTVAPRAARSARACLAWTALSSAAERGLRDLANQARAGSEAQPGAVAADLVAVVAGGPLFGATVATGALLELLNRVAPAPAPADAPDDASLLTHVLADATPTYLGNAIVRMLAVRSPWPVALGVRSGRATATVRVGRGEVVVTNGLEPDVVAVLDGDVDLLIEAASGTLLSELHEAADQQSS